ncbi:hypothetical protein MKW98_020866 [Papaver atlanticum]|uniref:Major facilitator superfamily (MFS) profile domain-containing protein n=1 Tax=Papaver atlanticum TaxID=357466 RepID=A0AAD4TGH5_9MAGN|nr:hypothetical protein MKW98_020866 [Papaver atlanticum]
MTRAGCEVFSHAVSYLLVFLSSQSLLDGWITYKLLNTYQKHKYLICLRGDTWFLSLLALATYFEATGFPSALGTVFHACIQVPITRLGALLMDKAGRRPLLFVSASGLLVGCLLLATSFYMQDHEIFLEAVPTLALTGILVFPLNIKGTTGSLVTLVNLFGSWVVSFTFNFLMSWSSYGTFLLYAAVNLLAILFIAKMVPETKGWTLEEIQASMNGS